MCARYRAGIFQRPDVKARCICVLSQPEYFEKLLLESAIGVEPTSLRTNRSQMTQRRRSLTRRAGLNETHQVGDTKGNGGIVEVKRGVVNIC
jgi:hypothetical protein